MIDAYASQRHYYEHLRPVWEALPDEIRGTFYTKAAADTWGRQLARGDSPRGLTLVAGASDAHKLAHLPLVYLEHGAGQAYPADPESALLSSYSGGAGLGHVVLFLAPGEAVAARWREAYPDTPVALVGCPRLDQHAEAGDPDDPVKIPRPAVSFTWHWDCTLVPETRSAWPHYKPRFADILAGCDERNWWTSGTQHPRWFPGPGKPSHTYTDLHLPAYNALDAMLWMTDVLVADNTSALYEAAALGKRVVVLNAPWYRRDVEHGLRFWSDVPGPQVDDPDPDAILAAIDESASPAWAEERQRISALTYAAPIGHATAAAVAATQEAHDAQPVRGN